MRHLVTVIVTTFLFMPGTSFAEIKTITHTIQQPFGGSQSPDDARIAGIARAKREALEQFGTYIESTTVVKDSQVDSDEILALTAGVTKAEIIKQKNYTDGDAFGIEISVKVELDTAVLEKSLQGLLDDRHRLADLKAANKRMLLLLAQNAELQEENKKAGRNQKQSAKLKNDFRSVSQKFSALDWFNKATVVWNGGKYSDPKMAIKYLTQAIRLDPYYNAAYIDRAIAYDDLKLYVRAINDYNQAISLDPDFVTTYYNRGITYNHLKQPIRAISDFDQAIQLDSNYAFAYGKRGDVYMDLEQFDRAIADYSKAIRLDPNDAISYNSRGGVYLRLKQPDRAISDFDQAIQLDSNYVNAYCNRGGAYDDLKQFDRAIADYDEAIRLNPTFAGCYYSRAITYNNINQPIRAIADYDEAVRLEPKFISAYINRGVAYIMSNQAKKGCIDLKKACSLGECEQYTIAKQDKTCR